MDIIISEIARYETNPNRKRSGCDNINAGMFFLREIYSHLRAGFRSETSFLLACTLLVILDCGAVIGLIWYFFFRNSARLDSSILLGISCVYVMCAWMVAMLATRFSRLMSIRAASLFYISVGLFFLLYSLMDLGGKIIAIWPWGVLWVFTIGVILSNLGHEFTTGRPNEPRE